MDSQRNEKPVIVIRRKGGGHAAHHGGAWKVAYADFVTAMMAFFLVMWLVNQSPEVRGAVASYIRDPLAEPSDRAGGAGILDGSPAALTPPVPATAQPPSKPDAEALDQLESKAKDLLQALMQLPALQGLAGQIEVELTPEGLRVQLMESENATFFDLGSPKLAANGLEALKTVGKVLGSMQHDVAVEGHTDSRPFADQDGYSNWELSVDRANSARRILESHGIDPARFKAVRGYAATCPRFPDHADPRNRRIAIILMRPGTTASDPPPAGAHS